MPDEPDWAAYAGSWVALVRGRIAGHGRTAREALLAAKSVRPREEPEVLYVGPDGKLAGSPSAATPVAGEAARTVLPSPPSPGVADQGAPYFTAPALVLEVVHLLNDLRVEGYLVGGTVRDMLLRRATHDIDVATTSDPFEAGRQLADRLQGAFYPMDEERGVARVIFTGQGARTYVDLASLRRDSIEDDLRCRDFTVNALALPLNALRWEALLDPTGGVEDLRAGLIRAVSPEAFKADPARLVRAVRLAQDLGFEIEPGTEARISAESGLLIEASAERVRDELSQMWAMPDAGACARQLDRLGLLRAIVPELEALRNLQQPWPHIWDALEHTMRTLEAVDAMIAAVRAGDASEAGLMPEIVSWKDDILSYLAAELSVGQSRLVMLKWAALLHDLGKAPTRTEQGGRVRFLGHPEEGAQLAAPRLNRLRYSAAATRLTATLVREHMRFLSLLRAPKISNRALYRLHRALHGDVPAGCLLFLADIHATREPGSPGPQWPEALRTVTRVLQTYYEAREQMAPPPIVSGRDLIEVLALPQGPLVGQLLESIREAQVEGTVRTRDEALDHAARVLRSRQRSSND